MDLNYKNGKIYDLDDLLDPTQMMTVLAGAGISMGPPSNLSSAQQIMNCLIDYGSIHDKRDLLRSIPSLQYEYIVQQFRDRFDTTLKILDYFIQATQFNRIHQILAVLIQYGNFVLTTNFDCLIEQAMVELDTPVNTTLVAVITKENFLTYDNPHQNFQEDRCCLYKLHGSPKNYFTNVDTKESVITTLDTISTGKEENQSIFSLPKYKQALLQQTDDERVLLVMGYGGGDTFDVMPEIEQMDQLQGVVWIDHNDSATHQESWQITNILESKSSTNRSSLDKFLQKVALSKEIPVFKVVAHTKNFLEHTFSHLITEGKPPPESDSNQSGFFSFQEWLSQTFNPPEDLSQFWFTSYILSNYEFHSEALEIYQRLKEGLDPQKYRIEFSLCLNNMGWIYHTTGQPQKALELYEQSYAIERQLGDQSRMANCLNNMGTLYEDTGQPQKALDLFEQSYTIGKQLGDQNGMANCLRNLGNIYGATGQPQKALELYEQSYAIVRQLGDQSRMASCLIRMGGIYCNTGKLQKGMDLFEQSYTIRKQLGDQRGMANSLNNMGEGYRHTGQPQKGMDLFEQSYTIRKQLGDQRGMASSLSSMGTIYKATGQMQKALELYEQAYTIRKQLGDQNGMAAQLNNMGTIYEATKKMKKALDLYEQSYIIFQQLGDKSGMADNLNNMGTINKTTGQPQKALELLEQAYAIDLQLGDKLGMTARLSNMGSIYKATGQPQKALELFEQAYAIDRQLGDQQGMAIRLNNMGHIYRTAGQLLKALDLFEQAYTILQRLQHRHATTLEKWIQEIKASIRDL